MRDTSFYSMEIQRFNKANPHTHISRIIKAMARKEEDLSSIFYSIRNNKEILNLLDDNYFPKTDEQLDSRIFEYDMSFDASIYNLLHWGAVLIKNYSEKINRYFIKKLRYEKALFREDFEEAYSILESIFDEFGISEWILSQHLILKYSKNNGGNENKNLLRKSFLKNHLLRTILTYYEKMANSSIGYEDYCQIIETMLEKTDKKSIRTKYLNYKLNINENKSVHEFKSALIIDEQISLVDYYETFVDVLQNMYCQGRIISLVKEIVDGLQNRLNDFRIRNLYIALGGMVSRNYINGYINDIIEKYTMGSYDELINEFSMYGCGEIVDFDLYNILLKANINVEKFNIAPKELWNEVYAIYSVQYNFAKSVNIIGGYLKLFYNTSWRYKIRGILSRKLNYIKDDKILTLCIINDKYLTPLFYQAILNEKDKMDYLNMFNNIAYNTICLHKYVLSGIRDEDVMEKINPIRVKFYTIKRKIQIQEYTQSISLCKAFMQDIINDKNKMYYQERISRILFSIYIHENFWLDAMHLYVDRFLQIKELVIRMPLDILVEGISCTSDYDENVKYDICKPIVLRLYYRGDDREVISAYMDYLEGQGCKTIIEYINRKKHLNRYEIFFLFNVCTESLLLRDYVSVSSINGNATDLRIYILRELFEKDEVNAKRYFEELNTLFKEIQLQYRRTAFNHNRIFIDKVKLLDYLNNTIKKEFSEYSKVQEIRKICNEDNELKDSTEEDMEYSYRFFYDIIEKIKQMYLFDSPYSLEDFLSARIRHVFCKDSLKKVIEEQTLFAKKLEDDSNEYVINEYWHNKLEKDDYSKVIAYLSQFSKKIDTKIQEVRDVWMRIKKDKDGEGMFDYCDFTNIFLQYAELDYSKILDSENEFYRSVIAELDKWTKRILENVRQRINEELKPFYWKALVDLETDIRNVNIKQDCKRELLRKIETTKAKYIEDICKFEDIFYMKSEQYPNFSIKEAIEFCCEIEKDINPKFSSVNLEICDKCTNIYSGEIFPYMVDIISILIHNAVEHSQLQNLNQLCIKLNIQTINCLEKKDGHLDNRLKDFSIVLNVKNNFADNVNEEELTERAMNIIGSMETNIFREKSKLVKGSGLYKIARTLYYNMDGEGAFFLKKEKGWFNLSVAMNLNNYLEEN